MCANLLRFVPYQIRNHSRCGREPFVFPNHPKIVYENLRSSDTLRILANSLLLVLKNYFGSCGVVVRSFSRSVDSRPTRGERAAPNQA